MQEGDKVYYRQIPTGSFQECIITKIYEEYVPAGSHGWYTTYFDIEINGLKLSGVEPHQLFTEDEMNNRIKLDKRSELLGKMRFALNRSSKAILIVNIDGKDEIYSDDDEYLKLHCKDLIIIP